MTSRITTYCLQYIVEHGATPLDRLGSAAREAGVTRARDPMIAVRTGIQHDPRVIELPDGRWEYGLRLLNGATLTHRVRSSTSDRDVLFPDLELAPLIVLLDHEPVRIDGGGDLTIAGGRRMAWSGPPVITGPPGWLPSVAAGATVALTWSSSGVRVSAADLDPEEVQPRAEEVRTVLARHARGLLRPAARPTENELARIVWSALFEVPDLLSAPLPPLDEVLELPPHRWPLGSASSLTYRNDTAYRGWSDDDWWPGEPDGVGHKAIDDPWPDHVPWERSW